VEKIAKNVAQSILSSKLLHTLTKGKICPKMKATLVFFQKLPKVNFHPLGEFSPNLVTLVQCDQKCIGKISFNVSKINQS
jgi:hypothetical protein